MNAEEAQEKLKAGVEALTTSEAWVTALTFAAKFHRYSFGNTLLIQIQCPEATRVAGFRKWLEMGRHVRKGERGIAILAPLLLKKEVETDLGRAELKVLRGFRVAHVFDVSQTEGADLPPDTSSFVTRLTGGTEDDRKLFTFTAAALVDRGWKVGRSTLPGVSLETNGYADFVQKSVQVRTGMDDRQSLKTLLHEFAHVILHDPTKYQESRPLCEAEAESAAFVAASVLGLDTSSYSFGYVAAWSGGKPEILQQAGSNAVRAAQEILAALQGDERKEAA